jgi:hypothetical protein
MRTIVLAWVLAAAAVGCTNTPGPQMPDGARAVASIRTSKCGVCHVPPQPGSRTRAHLEDAFTRHRTRVHLSNDQWAAMIDYLAGAAGATAQRTN